ncbi:DUF481 domain-containing protein [Spirosoma sp. KCTC 42546]|uniref:DUF481 domain-containing protein n=1 Tax=Spirosoma sp. KCTC 42546 TaxID=2520506 RepID=UPI00115B9D60|nr:DUF481 domain-containing protein [Spirosoma sp. KCTC 42546]QDK82866.1 DUF481 domain-containing protein [Spirosoma sp. KCTC 42546]
MPLSVKYTQQCLLTLSFLFTFTVAEAQIVEQPDPLRPSLPDSSKAVKRDSSKTAVSQQKIDSIKHAPPVPTIFRYRFTADGTITEGNVSRTLLQLTSAVDYQLSNYFKLSSNPSFVYGKQNGILAEREWFGDLRTTYRYEKRLYYLAFGSYERSNLRQINHRWTAAAGLGYKLLNHKRAYISLTDVVMQEYTDFVELNDINIWRNSARLYGEYSFDKDRFTITHTAFYQPALGQYNVRWNASLSLQIKLTQVVSLRSTVANAYESLVVPGRQNNDFRFTLGLVYEKK